MALSAGAALPVEDEEADLKAKLSQEQDPIRKARMQMRLAELNFQEARKHYEEEAVEPGLARLEEMLDFVEQARDTLFSTGHDPRKRPRGFKEVEIKLRDLGRRLDDLRVTRPVDEREALEKIDERIVEIRDELIHGIMRVKAPKK